MLLRDAKGLVLDPEKDSVSFAIGFGQAIEGRIVQVESGLLQNRQPMVHILFSIPLAVQQDGRIGGVFKLAEVEQVPASSIIQP